MPRLARIAIAFTAVLAACPAAAKPPIEAFGEVPEIRAMELSPDGKRVAYLRNQNGVEQLVLYDLATKKAEALATTGAFKTRGVSFPTDDHVLLHASLATRNLEYQTDKFEHTSAFAVNVRTRKAVQLLIKADWIHPAQSGLGRVLGISSDGKYALMPAYVLQQQLQADPTYDLLRVNLDTGVGVRIAGRSGVPSTKDWIINAKGEVVAREDYSSETEKYSIRVYNGDNSREILSRTGEDQSSLGYRPEHGRQVADRQRPAGFGILFALRNVDGGWLAEGPAAEARRCGHWRRSARQGPRGDRRSLRGHVSQLRNLRCGA